MQQDRNYRYAPCFRGERDNAARSRHAEEMREMPRSRCAGEVREAELSGCRDDCAKGAEKMVLAMAYVKDQPFEALYTPEEALREGTLFMGLNLPYGGYGGRSCKM